MIARRGAAKCRPWVMAAQEGGEFNAFPDLPPAAAPADLRSAGAAGAEAGGRRRALCALGVNGLLGPSLDVGFEGGSALGRARTPTKPQEVAELRRAGRGAYGAPACWPCPGTSPAWARPTSPRRGGPAKVGLGSTSSRRATWCRSAPPSRAGVPALLLSNALYPMNDFIAPGSQSREVVTDLLRGELGFTGVAMTDDLAEPAITVRGHRAARGGGRVRAGVDLVYDVGPAGRPGRGLHGGAARRARGRIDRARLDEAVGRILAAKRRLGLIG